MTFTYRDIATARHCRPEHVHIHVHRGHVDPEDLVSLAWYVQQAQVQQPLFPVELVPRNGTRKGGRPEKTFTFLPAEVDRATGLEPGSLDKAARCGVVDPEDLRSLSRWVTLWTSPPPPQQRKRPATKPFDWREEQLEQERAYRSVMERLRQRQACPPRPSGRQSSEQRRGV